MINNPLAPGGEGVKILSQYGSLYLEMDYNKYLQVRSFEGLLYEGLLYSFSVRMTKMDKTWVMHADSLKLKAPAKVKTRMLTNLSKCINAAMYQYERRQPEKV